MPGVYRIRSLWTGFQGAPGYTNHFFQAESPAVADATTVAGRVQAFWAGIKLHLPSVVTITVESEVTVFDITTGEPASILAITPPAAVVGGTTGIYSGPSGAVVNWKTGVFEGGRQIQGRTYVVPLIGQAYDSSGTLDSTVKSDIQTAANGMIGDSTVPQFVVFRRPRVNVTPAYTPVASAVVPDKSCVLTSRRD